MSDIAWIVDRLGKTYWLVEAREPPSNPLYVALFPALFLILVLSIYTYRAAPDWLLPGTPVWNARWLAASLATFALIGEALILAEMMRIPFASRGVWLWLCVALLVAQIGYIALLVALQRRSNTGSRRHRDTE